MIIKGEIVLIDKDEFEQSFFNEIKARINLVAEIKHFQTPEEGFDYLKSTNHKIFVIISVVEFGSGQKAGFEFKKKINEDAALVLKAVPFVFMCFLDDKDTIDEAYQLNIQGYFRKPLTLDGSTQVLSAICNYWTLNLRPDEM